MSAPKEAPLTSQYLHSMNTSVWSNGRHSVRCVKVIEETLDVKTFCFMSEQPVMFFFKPGQFVTLELELAGEQVMRSYTISSSPSVPYSFSLTVKRVLGGQVSNWLLDNLDEGDELAVHGPVGQFNCVDFPADKILMLSGGVGITPLMSMARWFFDTNGEVDMCFVHSARTPRDIIYHRELEHMCSRINNFSLHLICEQQVQGQAWSGYRGFLDQSKLEIIAPDFMEREVFCCGPAPYMAAVKALLQINGFEMSRYHEESFAATPASVQQDAIDQAETALSAEQALNQDEMLAVKFSSTGKSVRVAPGETVHSAAFKLGMRIPKACGVGVCGSCRVLKTSGEVVMTDNGGITDEEVDEGYILSCCSVPASNITIE